MEIGGTTILGTQGDPLFLEGKKPSNNKAEIKGQFLGVVYHPTFFTWRFDGFMANRSSFMVAWGDVFVDLFDSCLFH